MFIVMMRMDCNTEKQLQVDNKNNENLDLVPYTKPYIHGR